METRTGAYFYKTGFKSLDELYPGGFIDGSLNVIVGSCCSFKTTVISQFDKSRTLTLENVRINSDNFNESISDIEDVYLEKSRTDNIKILVLDNFCFTVSSNNIYEVKYKLFYALDLLAKKHEIAIFITQYPNKTFRNEVVDSTHLAHTATTITHLNRKGKSLRIKSLKNRYGKLKESFCYYNRISNTLLSKPQWLFKLIYKLKK